MKDLKVIVFDFDDTLYIGKVWGNFRQYNLEVLKTILSDEEAEKLLQESIENNNGKIENDHIVLTLRKHGFDDKKYVDNLCDNVYIHPSEPTDIIDDEFLKELRQKYHLYICSMSTQNYLKKYVEKYKINPKYFRGIYSADLKNEDTSKMLILKRIIEEEKVSPNEVLMVGDDYVRDIISAQKVKVNTLYFDKRDFNQIYKFFTENDILDCRKFIK